VPSAALFGGLGGVLLGYAIAWLSGYPLAWMNLLLLMCAIGGAWFLLANWTKGGSLPQRLPIVAAIALLINLLAAGGISFPAVADSLWLLLALQLNALEGSNEQVRSLAPPAGVRWLTGLALAALLFAAIWLHYIPVLNSRLQLSLSDSARATGDAAAHRNALEAAVAILLQGKIVALAVGSVDHELDVTLVDVRHAIVSRPRFFGGDRHRDLGPGELEKKASCPTRGGGDIAIVEVFDPLPEPSPLKHARQRCRFHPQPPQSKAHGDARQSDVARAVGGGECGIADRLFLAPSMDGTRFGNVDTASAGCLCWRNSACRKPGPTHPERDL
jgi:hypothetical protein